VRFTETSELSHQDPDTGVDILAWVTEGVRS
jgi:hypothetical protein